MIPHYSTSINTSSFSENRLSIWTILFNVNQGGNGSHEPLPPRFRTIRFPAAHLPYSQFFLLFFAAPSGSALRLPSGTPSSFLQRDHYKCCSKKQDCISFNRRIIACLHTLRCLLFLSLRFDLSLELCLLF